MEAEREWAVERVDQLERELQQANGRVTGVQAQSDGATFKLCDVEREVEQLKYELANERQRVGQEQLALRGKGGEVETLYGQVTRACGPCVM